MIPPLFLWLFRLLRSSIDVLIGWILLRLTWNMNFCLAGNLGLSSCLFAPQYGDSVVAMVPASSLKLVQCL